MDLLLQQRALITTVIAVALLLVLVLRLRMHAFPALLVVSLFAALAGGMSGETALKTVTQGMGGTLGFIAIVIGLGAMFGVFLEASGGVQSLSEWIIDKTGLSKGPWTMGIIGLIVAIPVFFDVALIILAPIVFSLAKKAGRAPLVFGLPLLAGLATAHAFVPPTPGPIAVAELLEADLGWVILFGLIAGAAAMVIAGPLYTQFAEKRGWLNTSRTPPLQAAETAAAEDGAQMAKIALAVIAVPLLLILIGTLCKAIMPDGQALRFITFIGHPITALLIACGLGYIAFKPKSADGQAIYRRALSKALEPTGAVILITGAGGAFKQVLIATGAGQALAEATIAIGLTPIVAGFVLALLVRVAQGSATVAMITAAGLTAPIVTLAELSAPQTALVVIAIAAGASACSHVNDSGFWLVNRYFGQSEAQTLRTWTVTATLVGFVGFIAALLLSVIV